MNERRVQKPDGEQSGSGPTPAARMREFGIFKDVRKGPLEIKDSDALLKLAGGKDLVLKGDVVISSDIWQRFPYGIEIEGNLRCSVLMMLDHPLKVTGTMNASIVELQGDLDAGGIRACSVKSGGSVTVEGDIEAMSLVAKTASATTILGKNLNITQHLESTNVYVEEFKAGSARVVSLVAPVVEVEYDLRCMSVTAKELTAGTIEKYGSIEPIMKLGRRTLTGKAGRPWKDSVEQPAAPTPE